MGGGEHKRELNVKCSPLCPLFFCLCLTLAFAFAERKSWHWEKREVYPRHVLSLPPSRSTESLRMEDGNFPRNTAKR